MAVDFTPAILVLGPWSLGIGHLSLVGAKVLSGVGASMPRVGALSQFDQSDSPTERYARVSVRWAALWHLAEFAQGPMRNGEIADAIREGGYQSKAGSFANAVSAVLYGMREKGEVDGNGDTGYYVTDKGRQTWALIKQGVKFRDATSPIEHSLLSAQ